MEFSTTLRVAVDGRILIPIKLRNYMGLQEGSTLELFSDGREIRLRKCILQPSNDKQLDDYLETLRSILSCGILLCDKTSILTSKNIYVRNGTPITQEITNLLQEGKERILDADDNILPIAGTRYPLIAFFPIINIQKPEKKSALLLCKKGNQTITDMELGSAKMTAATISHYINK